MFHHQNVLLQFHFPTASENERPPPRSQSLAHIKVLKKEEKTRGSDNSSQSLAGVI